MPVILLLSVSAIWGSTFVVVQDAVQQMPVHPFLAWRFTVATAVMLVLRPKAVFALPPTLRRKGFLAGLALAGGYLTQTVGLAMNVSPTVSGFITGMFVVFTPLVTAMLFKSRVPGITWVAVALATAGLALLSLRGFSIGSGELITLVCALLFAFHIVLLSRWSAPEHAYGLTVLQLATVAGLEALVTLVTNTSTTPPNSGVWTSIIFLAVFATAYGFVIQTWAQSHMSATRAAVILTSEPVFAGIAGVLTGDRLTTRIALGAMLVLIAMYVVELGPRMRGEPDVITESVH